jgi:hypothetical protein
LPIIYFFKLFFDSLGSFDNWYSDWLSSLDTLLVKCLIGFLFIYPLILIAWENLAKRIHNSMLIKVLENHSIFMITFSMCYGYVILIS